MPLPDHRIQAAIESGGPADNRLSIAPFNPANVQPASYDVTLAPTFRVYAQPGRRVSLRDIPADLTHEVDGSDGFVMRPGDFALGSTIEMVQIPNWLAVQFDGRSTLGRLGLSTHITAGWLDPGFKGWVTVELSNDGPLELELHPGDPIGQLIFYPLTSPCDTPYGDPRLRSRYQDQQGTCPPRAHTEVTV